MIGAFHKVARHVIDTASSASRNRQWTRMNKEGRGLIWGPSAISGRLSHTFASVLTVLVFIIFFIL